MKNQTLLLGILFFNFLLSTLTVKAQNCLNVATQINNVLCPTDHYGSIKLTPTGGSGNYTYDWQEVPNFHFEFLGSLAVGTYHYTVTDNSNQSCFTTGVANIVSTSVMCSVGVNDLELAQAISVFPNPSNGNVNIVSKTSGNYKLVDILGHTVDQIYLNAGLNLISLDHLSQGIYFLQNGVVISDKILIQ